MLNRSRTWAVMLLAATFAAGAAVGAGGRALWVRYAAAAAPERPRGIDRMMSDLDDELRLTPVQHDSVRAILQRQWTRLGAVWWTVRRRGAEAHRAAGARGPAGAAGDYPPRSGAAGARCPACYGASPGRSAERRRKPAFRLRRVPADHHRERVIQPELGKPLQPVNGTDRHRALEHVLFGHAGFDPQLVRWLSTH